MHAVSPVLPTADRNFYAFDAWGLAAGSGAALLWRAPTQLRLPVLEVLPDGTFTSVLINPRIRSPRRREAIMAAARAGEALDPAQAHLVRVVEYDIPDREGNTHRRAHRGADHHPRPGRPPAPTSSPPPTTSDGVRHEVAHVN